MYDSADYANDRLAGTIVRYDNKPVKVIECYQSDDSIFSFITPIWFNKKFKVPLNKLNLEPVPLGFANTNMGIAYLTRISMRKDWKQGLRDNTLKSTFGLDCRHVTAKNLHDCIVGKYPSLDGALDICLNEGKPTAFSRDFAVTKQPEGILLLYKWEGSVGDVVNGKVRLFNTDQHLVESLEMIK